jgi:1-acyl-sn-glycerol-3-phosphate acyltransferase
MINKFFSILIYFNALAMLMVIGPLFVISSFILPKYWMYRSSQLVCYLLLKSLFVRVDTNGSLPKEGNYIYMFNHGSFIDPFVFAYIMESPCTALIAKENYRYPIWKSMLKRWDAIPIDRSNKQAAIESVKAAEEFLKRGMNVIILPEGTRTITGNLSRFKKGGFHMAYNTKIPIVPIGCIGAFEFKPKNRWTLSPRTITVNFGDSIDPDSYDQLGVEGILKKTEEEIKRLSNGKFKDE